MRRGVAPLTGLQSGEFIYFASYTLSGLMLLFSSFLLTLLENYDLLVLLLHFHALGVLRPSAPAPVATLHHASGDLHPPLRYVHVHAAVSAPVLPLPHATLFQEEPNPSRWLLLPAPDQGSICVHRCPHSQQVRPLEGALGDHAG
jgi:hypothetical protein